MGVYACGAGIRLGACGRRACTQDAALRRAQSLPSGILQGSSDYARGAVPQWRRATQGSGSSTQELPAPSQTITSQLTVAACGVHVLP